LLIAILIVLLGQVVVHAQVFPEVNNPVQQKIKERQEKEKLGSFYYNDRQYEKAADVYKELFDENPTHFYYTYYVYTYATSFAASELMAQRLREEGEQAVDDFLRFLSSGGSDYPVELLKIAGVDMSTPVFYIIPPH